jgi:hypothetical protein
MSFERTRLRLTKASLITTVSGKTYLLAIYTSTTMVTLHLLKALGENSICARITTRFTPQGRVTRISVPTASEAAT